MVSPYVLIRATRKGIYLAANAEVDGYITLTFLNERSSNDPLTLVLNIYITLLWAPHLNPLRADMSSASWCTSLGTPQDKKTGYTLTCNPIKILQKIFWRLGLLPDLKNKNPLSRILFIGGANRAYKRGWSGVLGLAYDSIQVGMCRLVLVPAPVARHGGGYLRQF